MASHRFTAVLSDARDRVDHSFREFGDDLPDPPRLPPSAEDPGMGRRLAGYEFTNKRTT